MVTLELDLIAAHLEGLEETIIHRLIDRAQFAANPPAYEPGHSGFEDGGDRSLFDLRLRYQEEMDAAFGRYQVPEERPFHANLPAPRRRVRLPESPLAIDDLDVVNLTPRITAEYKGFLDRLCAPTATAPRDDGQYGSSVEHDVLAIQAVARRVHFGALYVAESKYRSNRSEIDALIEAGDRGGVLDRITRPEVEARILRRVADKVDYVQATINEAVRRRVDPTVMLDLYRDLIIPLTKEGELRYLFNRRR
ncbi:MAG: chorismate mutase [Spirochaetota bacterium]